MILGLAQLLSLRSIGEGVETSAQAAFLRRHGCHDLQGFYFARPMPPEALKDWLDRYRQQQHQHQALAAGE